MNASPSASKNSQDKVSPVSLVMEVIKQQPSQAEKIGITKKQLELLYSLGFRLYQTESYRQAADIFRLLCFYEPTNSRNWIGLGGANQRIKNHYAAASSFAMASMYDPLNPEPKFYAAHSFIDLKDLSAALKCAKVALDLCKKDDNTKALKSRVQALYNAITTQLTIG